MHSIAISLLFCFKASIDDPMSVLICRSNLAEALYIAIKCATQDLGKLIERGTQSIGNFFWQIGNKLQYA